MNGRRLMQMVLALTLLVALASIWPRRDVASPERSPAQSSEQPVPARQAADGAGFDFYVLVLSWSPTHCASEAGRGRDDELQCRSGRTFGFVLHGLWPQRERGFPEYCVSGAPRAVSDGIVRDIVAIAPSRTLIQHEWERHGTCSGLSQRDYFSAAAQAFGAVEIPSAYRALSSQVETTPDEVRDEFLQTNPELRADGVAATCRRGELAEVWVCLDVSLRPRTCSSEIRKRHCGGRDVKMRAMRGNWPR